MTIQWLLGAFGGCVVVIVGAIVVLLRVSFSLGKVAQRIEKVAEDMVEMKTNTAKVPLIEVRLATAEEAWEATRSDFKELRRAVWGRSSPGFNGEE